MSGSAGETPAGTSATLTDFTIAAGTTYTGDDGSATYLADAVTNDGTIALVPVASQTNLNASGTVTLDGTGVVLLGTTGLGFVNGGGGDLTIGAGQTVDGGGEIYTAINDGTIVADGAAPLILQQVTNAGTFLAVSGGTLEVAGATPNSGLIEAAGGTILVTGQIAQSGTGVVDVRNGATLLLDLYGAEISGGTLEAEAGAVLASDTYAVLADVTVAAGTTFTGEDGSSTALLGTITNDGTLAIEPVSNPTFLETTGAPVTIEGTGLILLGDAAPAYFFGGGVTTIGAGQTIEGAGQVNGVLSHGTIIADGSIAGTSPLTVGSSTNEGTLLAINGGTLIVSSGGTNDGLVEEDGGALDVVNGTLDQSATGLIELIGGTGDIGDFSGGTILVTAGATLTLGGGTNSGLIEADGGTILIAGALTQAGTGAIDLLAGASLLLDQYGATITGGTLSATAGDLLGNTDNYGILDGVTLAAGTKFTGEDGSNTGLLGTIINDGTLSLAPTSTEAQFGATGTVVVAGTGLILLGDAAPSYFYGNSETTIDAGQTIEGAGQVDAVLNDGTIIADGSIAGSAALDVSNITNDSTLLAINAGTLEVSQSSTNDSIVEEDAATLLVTGTLDQSAAGLIELIGGTGDIGDFAGGTILVKSGATLTIGTGTNSGLIEADGGTILIAGTLTQTGTGQTELLSGSTLLLDRYSATIAGGTLSATPGAVLGNAAGQYGILDGVTLTAGTDFTGEDGSNTALLGTITNDGTLSLAPLTAYITQFTAGGSLDIAGTGLIRFGVAAQSYFGGNDETTIGAGQTVEGGGQIDSVVNDGTVLATLSTPLQVSNTTNDGTLLATNGGTLVVNGGTNDSLIEEKAATLLGYNTIEQSATGLIELIGGTSDIGDFSGGTILVTSGATLTLAGTNSGLIEADGGTILIAGTLTQTGAGLIDVLSGSTLLLDQYGAAITGGTLTASPGAVIGNAAHTYGSLADATLTAGTDFTGEDGSNTQLSGTITNDGTLSITPVADYTQFAADGALAIDGTGLIVLGAAAQSVFGGNDETTIGAGQTFEGAGQVDGVINDGTGIAALSAPLLVSNATNAGTLQARSGGTLDLETVTNTGLTRADGGLVLATGTVAGSGTLSVGNGGTLSLSAPVDPGQTIDFGGDGTGTLLLQQPGTNFASAITGLADGDRIEVLPLGSGDSIAAASVTSPGTITITGNFTPYQITDVSFAPGANQSFTVGHDATTGLNDIVVAACYLRGTRIATPSGEVPIEDVRIGDKVLTVSGAARTVRWIGRRGYAGRFARRNPAVMPVLIRAGALADGVPRRDLFVSPQHAMWLDGDLIEARALCNGVSIATAEIAGPIDYVHLELDTHDVLLAEDAPSESFVDDDSRMIFANAAEFLARYGDTPRVAARYCAPRVSGGPALEAVRHRIAVRAGLRQERSRLTLHGAVERVEARLVAGWAQNPDHPEAPVCLDILVAGTMVAQTLANLPRADLAVAGPGRFRHGFSVMLPSPLTPREQFLAEVRRSLDGAVLPRGGSVAAA